MKRSPEGWRGLNVVNLLSLLKLVKLEEVVGPPGFDDCQSVCHGDC